MVKEAELNRIADEEFEHMTRLRNKADHLIHSVNKQLDEATETLSTKSKQPILRSINQLESVKADGTKAELEKKLQGLASDAASILRID